MAQYLLLVVVLQLLTSTNSLYIVEVVAAYAVAFYADAIDDDVADVANGVCSASGATVSSSFSSSSSFVSCDSATVAAAVANFSVVIEFIDIDICCCFYCVELLVTRQDISTHVEDMSSSL